MNGYNTLKYRELQGNIKYNQFINGAKIGFFG